MARFQIYKFKHPKTCEIFSDFRNVENADDEFKAPDGIVCEPHGLHMIKKKSGVVVNGKEGFEKHPDYYKEMNPKFVKYRDGHKERYDPTRHC